MRVLLWSVVLATAGLIAWLWREAPERSMATAGLLVGVLCGAMLGWIVQRPLVFPVGGERRRMAIVFLGPQWAALLSFSYPVWAMFQFLGLMLGSLLVQALAPPRDSSAQR